ncbi:MAG: hypothetical protein HYX24_01480 [Candidatus Aenigmarchaeota archaeon]|nr:hypothetical protein [Candidatus Aenigmarchaeota archaeon]
MKGDVSEEQSYFIGAVVIGLMSLVVIVNVFVLPFMSDKFKATNLAADISFYMGAFSILESDEKGEVEIVLDRKYDIEFKRLGLADIERLKHISKTFAGAGLYVTAYAYKKDGKDREMGQSMYIIVDDADETKFTASEYIKIIKKPGEKTRFEYL